MPRYFFEVSNEDTVYDDAEGAPYRNDEAALRGAHRLADELSNENPEFVGCKLTVWDEGGTPIGELTVLPPRQMLQ